MYVELNQRPAVQSLRLSIRDSTDLVENQPLLLQIAEPKPKLSK